VDLVQVDRFEAQGRRRLCSRALGRDPRASRNGKGWNLLPTVTLRPDSRTSFPKGRSDARGPYTSAVSKELSPWAREGSNAARMIVSE
jgi:hypothetical protein